MTNEVYISFALASKRHEMYYSRCEHDILQQKLDHV